ARSLAANRPAARPQPVPRRGSGLRPGRGAGPILGRAPGRRLDDSSPDLPRHARRQRSLPGQPGLRGARPRRRRAAPVPQRRPPPARPQGGDGRVRLPILRALVAAFLGLADNTPITPARKIVAITLRVMGPRHAERDDYLDRSPPAPREG